MTDSTFPLLVTKISPPRLGAGLLPRRSLLARLPDLTEARLVLVSAPAGFGKTTLLAEWSRTLREQGVRVAWYSLDQGDNDPVRFVSYLLRASSGEPNARGGPWLGLPAPEALEAAIAEWINHAAASSESTLVVLDDYHVVTAPAVHSAVAYLIERLPPHVTVALGTRSDPPLPLSRLRARGQLVELRAADLRFSAAEVGEFLRGGLDQALSAGDVEAIERSTEGWAAGLQLVRMVLAQVGSRPGSTDASAYLARFSAGRRFTFDYLTDEVFLQQPRPVRDFLLRTCVLEQLSGPLCAEVVGLDDAAAMLDLLERANLFTVALDDRRRWYRYHHLFREFLRERLDREAGVDVSNLHARAGAWFERNGMMREAISHALAAGDVDRAAGWLSSASRSMLGSSQIATFLRLVEQLPEEAVRARPALTADYAWALVLDGQTAAAEAQADRVEADLSSGTVADEEGGLRASLAAVRAYVALRRADLPGALRWGELALAGLPPREEMARVAVSLLLASGRMMSMDLAGAKTLLEDTQRVAIAAGNYFVALQCFTNRARIEVRQGRLGQAARILQEGLDLGAGWAAGGPLPATGYLHVQLAKLAYERGDLDGAERAAGRGVGLGEQFGTPPLVMSGWEVQAAVMLARGDASLSSAPGRAARPMYWTVSGWGSCLGVWATWFGRSAS